jgi:hypothetical protein
MKKTFILCLFIILFFSGSVFAEDRSSSSPSMLDIVGDVLCIRPLGFVRVIIEAAAFGVSFPVTTRLKKVDAAREFLIKDPYSFHIERSLGEM